MNPNNEWLKKEVDILSKEKKAHSKKYDTVIFRRLMVLLIPLLLFGAALNGMPSILMHGSAQWTCKRCGCFNDSHVSDWKGDHYCGRCGTRMGDE